MSSSTRLEFMGTTCDLWRQPTTHDIDFNFPCGTIRGN
jgi:hypothetical protein